MNRDPRAQVDVLDPNANYVAASFVTLGFDVLDHVARLIPMLRPGIVIHVSAFTDGWWWRYEVPAKDRAARRARARAKRETAFVATAPTEIVAESAQLRDLLAAEDGR